MSWRFERIGEKWPLEEVLLYYLTVIIRLFSFNLKFICSSVICKKLNCIRHTSSRSFDTFEKHTRGNEASLIMYTTGGGGGGGGAGGFLGGLKIFWGKRGGGEKISEGSKRGCQFF